MDYLDPRTEIRHRIILFTGYVLIAVAIVTTSLVMLYQAYGFGLKNGNVTQNGLTFFSSQPHPAKIYIDEKLQKVATNSRLVLPAGIYHAKLTRSGYDNWQRRIVLDGGSVEHFDYPFLFPQKLVTKKIPKAYIAAPGFITQSNDRRWLVVQQPNTMTEFDMYDLKNPDKAPLVLSLPVGILSKATAHENWQLGEWADDNQHVLLRHMHDDKTEFILVDRTVPEQALNLNTSLSLNPTSLTLANKKYDRYYVYDEAAASLQVTGLKAVAPTLLLRHVLAYHSYGDDTLLYATDNNDQPGKVQIKLKTRDRTSDIRSLPAATTYLLNLTKYDGTMYVAVGAASQNKVYIYRDPVGQLNTQANQAVTPIQVLHVEQPSYLSFSTNAQFIVAENGTRFGVYDIQNKAGYNYTTRQPLDIPQVHASWMDGDRLSYVSGGKLNVFDYDSTNRRTLMPASSDYLPAFAPNYKDVYAIAPSNNELEMTQTSLLLPKDR